MTKDVAAERILRDAMTREMNYLRVKILSAEARGDWKAAAEAKDELSELHALAQRKEYSAHV